MNRFAGKVAFITGSSRGIGRAIALRLAEEGADVAVHGREQSDAAEAVASEIRALGRGAEPVAGDVRSETQVAEMLRAAEEALGAIGVWVNNAGIEHEEPLDEILEAHWDETFAVNVKGLFFCSRAAAAHMTARGGGVIINIASRFGFIGDPSSLPYGASKAAVINITKALAKQYAPTVRVNAVAPAYTPTGMMAHVSEDYIARFNAATPMARITRAEDTAAAVAFLASDDASFTTGATLLVDGGYTLK
ncbi:MAG: glucose 1-dehydrogenase [SAR324 cluster bacterium]|nr:glucose 1-dehydrogenase [SAR324 cluster bacterium]